MADSYRKPWDFFLSYATEDRDGAATPLANELASRGFNVWLDDPTLVDGDGLEKQHDQLIALVRKHALPSAEGG